MICYDSNCITLCGIGGTNRIFFHLPMKKRLKRLACTLICFLLITATERTFAQFFVADNQPSALSKKQISMDTIFYSPDETMPFDKSFYLRYILKGAHEITYFTISPVNRDGDVRNRRRDRRVFIRSGWSTSKDRRHFKRLYPYNTFRHMEQVRFFTAIDQHVETVKTSKNTIITLKVSPLDPNRNYRITLFEKADDSKASTMTKAGEIIFRGYNNTGAAQGSDTVRYTRQVASIDDHWYFLKTHGFIYGPTISFVDPTLGLNINLVPTPTLKTRRRVERHIKSIKYDVQGILVGTLQGSLLLSDGRRRALDFFDGRPREIKLVGITSDGTFNLTYTRTVTLERWRRFAGDEIHLDLNPLQFLKKRKERSITSQLGALTIANRGRNISYTQPTLPVIDRYAVGTVNAALGQKPRNTYQNIIDTIAVYNNACTMDIPPITNVHIVLDSLSQCPCEDAGVESIKERNALAQLITNFFRMNDTDSYNFQKGILRLDNFNELALTNDYKKIAKNIDFNIDALNKILNYAQWLSLRQNAATFDSFIDEIERVKIPLTTFKVLVKKINDGYVAIDKSFVDALPDAQVRDVYNTTSSLDFMNTAKASIVPDFGFLAMFKGGESANVETILPYLGFNVNFRPIDKSIPLHLVRYKSWRYRFTFTSGVTLTPIKLADRREDLFGNYSLVTGIGFRLSNYIKLTGGVIWFKASSTDPLSTSTYLSCLPYAGLTADFEIVDLFGGISKLFK